MGFRDVHFPFFKSPILSHGLKQTHIQLIHSWKLDTPNGPTCARVPVSQNGEPMGTPKSSNWSSDFKHGWQILKEGLKWENHLFLVGCYLQNHRTWDRFSIETHGFTDSF